MTEPRDVIVQTLWRALGQEPYLTMPDRADAILAALADAGYVLVRRPETHDELIQRAKEAKAAAQGGERPEELWAKLLPTEELRDRVWQVFIAEGLIDE